MALPNRGTRIAGFESRERRETGHLSLALVGLGSDVLPVVPQWSQWGLCLHTEIASAFSTAGAEALSTAIQRSTRRQIEPQQLQTAFQAAAGFGSCKSR
eukprot:2728627-Lingulodinium_polyedra.AAC.1